MESKFVPIKRTTIWAAIILIAAAINWGGPDVFQLMPFIVLLGFTLLMLVAWGLEEALRR